MKKYSTLILLLFVTFFAFSQSQEKIKGSKIVTTENKAIGPFDTIEADNNLEVFLERGENGEIKIEADDNLHSIISIDLLGKSLRVGTTKKAYRYKKLTVRITYTGDLKSITANDETVINAIQELQLNDLTINTFGKSVLNLNVNVTNFTFKSNDDSKTDLNLKAETAFIELSKKAELNSLLNLQSLKMDLYQKAKATIEGNADITNFRLDNNSELIANNFVAKKLELLTEDYSKCSVNCNDTISIEASGNSDISLYGDQKTDLKRFTDNAVLRKKPTK